MAKTATAKAVLKLDDVIFVRGIKNAIKMAKDLGAQFAKNPIKTSFLAAALSAQKAASTIGSTLKVAATVAATAFAVTAAAVGGLVIGLGAISVKAVEVAAQFETMQVGFEVFLGSAKAAEDQMESLKAFSAKTPFQIGEIGAASRQLHVLTQGALDNVKGWTLVGDAASAVNEQFSQMAVTVGRLYADLRGGAPIGESLRSLRDSGAVTPEGANRIQLMAGIDSAQAWKLAQTELSRFSGMMEKKAQTWEGLMSTFHDQINLALAAFGKPIMESLKPVLRQFIAGLDMMRPKIKEIGEALGEALKFGIGLLEGAIANPQALLEAFESAFVAIGHSFIGVLEDGLVAVTSKLASAFGDSGLAKLMGFNPSALVYNKTQFGGSEIGPRDNEFHTAIRKFQKLSEGGMTAFNSRYVNSEDSLPNPPLQKAALFGHSTALQSGGLSTNGTTNDAWASGFFKTFVGPKLPSLLSQSITRIGADVMGAGALTQGAHRTVNSLLPLAERRHAEALTRAARIGENYRRTGRFTTGGAGGVVRRGDHAAALAYARDKQRDALEGKTQIELTQVLIRKFDEAWLKR